MAPVLRFAPSPTGYLHLGNARTALFNHLFALRHGGSLILRLDDTDSARSTEAFAAAIVEDLAWLGIRPVRTERQSARRARHDAVAEQLRAEGLLYPCYESAEELDYARRRRIARGQPPVYDRAALRLTGEERARLEGEGRRPHWRFLLPNHAGDPFRPVRRTVTWTDLCRGSETVDLSSLSDPVLVREDGSYLYTLPSVIDDADFGVTHVIRGADHVTNTGVQIALFEAMGAAVPAFGHHNLLLDAEGEGLSKRTGSMSLRSLREAGYEAGSVAALAVMTGGAHPPVAVDDPASLAADFNPADASLSPARVDTVALDRLNADLVHAMSIETALARLAARGIPADPPFWEAVRGNCGKLADAKAWRDVIDGATPALVEEADRPFLVLAARLLPDDPLDAGSYRAWTDRLKAESGRSGKALHRPLRLALTGRDTGPEMAQLLPLIGRRATLDRLA